MKKSKLTMKETLVVASTLFGMFFGAGNLIFPVQIGQEAGSSAWPAVIGFCITAVTIPILAVAAIGNTHSDNLLQLASKAGPRYGKYFTLALYLTIGPLFAIPRCASLSFTTGLEPLVGGGAGRIIAQIIFTVVFFAVVLFFSLRPGKITTWIGRIINPIFLAFLAILVTAALVSPGASMYDAPPEAAYESGALFTGFIKGYGTMDAIAGLAFGIVIIDIVRDLGVDNDNDVARETLKAGAFTALLMGIIYVLTIIIGAKSKGLFGLAANGGIALTQISNHYLGGFGQLILALTITFACLKTAIGLVTSCGEMFVRLIPGKLNYRGWTLVFTVFSLIVSNVGLTAIIKFAVPVLSLIYPPAIVLIILALTEKLFGSRKEIYLWASVGAFIPAVFDCLKDLGITAAGSLGSRIFPLFDQGLGWIVPSLIGVMIGLIASKINKRTNAA